MESDVGYYCIIYSLLEKRRTPIEPVRYPRIYEWNMVDPKDILTIDQTAGGEFSDKALFTLHEGIALHEVDTIVYTIIYFK